MNSLASSYSHPTHPHSADQRQKTYTRYDEQSSGTSFFAPLLQWLLLFSVVLAVILMMIFCTQPMTAQTLVSDFWAGVDGVQMLFR
jgi:hypothetical protein